MIDWSKEPRYSPRKPTDDYKIVYSGGWHDVWCNGNSHIWSFGGRAGRKIGGEAGQYGFQRFSQLCDCHKYASRSDLTPFEAYSAQLG